MIFSVLILLLFFLWGRRLWLNRKTMDKFDKIYQLLLFIPLFLFITYQTRVLPGSQTISDRLYVEELTGQAFWTKQLYEYIPSRAFNGDGYSLNIFSINEEVSENLIEPNGTFYSNYPKSSRVKWIKQKWKKTPVEYLDQKFLDFALPVYGGNRNSGLTNKYRMIRKLLNKKGSYYSYTANMSGERVMDIDFYVLSPKDKIIITINHNM